MLQNGIMFVVSGFRREVAENCALLAHYAANSGNFLPTFRDNLSVQSSGAKNPPPKNRILEPRGWYPVDCPETSVINLHYSLRNNAEVGITCNYGPSSRLVKS